MSQYNGLGLNNSLDFNTYSRAISDFKVSCTIKLEKLVYNIVKVKLSSLFQNCSHQFNLFTSSDYSQPNRHMPGSILGIDNHSVALAIDVAISSIYTDSCMHGPGPFMF